jgi:Holliday junction resolvase-like predicted endonuclease
MGQQGVWEISGSGPRRLSASAVELDQHLEEWIERDPSLVQGGLTIVARQLHTEAGPLDLLALDPQGRWVVIEVKRGMLRRETVAQAIDYASAIAAMTHGDLEQVVNTYLASRGEKATLRGLLLQRQVTLDGNERIGEVAIIVVGTGRDRSLERMVDYLTSPGNIAITAISFEVFALAGGKQVLVREIAEDEGRVPAGPESSAHAMDAILARAEAAGTGREITAILQAAQRLGLHPRPWKVCLMFAPPANKTRCLFTVWTEPTPEGDLTIYVAADTFGEFYHLSRQQVGKALFGVNKYVALPRNKVPALIDGLNRLLTPVGGDD